MEGVFTIDNVIVHLSRNRLTVVHTHHYKSLHFIKYLDISNNPTEMVTVNDPSIFDASIDFRVMYVVTPETCCLQLDVTCVPDIKSEDYMGSCQEVISHMTMKYVLWVYLMLCTFTNTLSFTWTLFKNRHEMKSFHFLGCNLHMADGLVAVYLMCLLIADMVYNGDLGYVAFKWKRSNLCQAISFILMLSIQLSNLSTLLIAIDRFLIIVWHPLERYGMTIKVALLLTPTCWCIGAILPSISITAAFNGQSNNACILVGKSLSMPYLVTYLIFTVLIFFIISGVYIAVIRVLHKSGSISKSRQMSLTPLVLRLGVIVLTNLLCWLTMGIMTIVSLSGFPLVSSSESLVSLVIFPLNSIINPIINTFVTKQFLSSVRTICDSHRTTKPENIKMRTLGKVVNDQTQDRFGKNTA
jgi:hypothetical protein